jgi:hypothetical protein
MLLIIKKQNKMKPKSEFDLNIDPEQRERLKKLFGMDKDFKTSEFKGKKNKLKFTAKIKRFFGR